VCWVLHSSPVATAPLPPRCFSVEHPAPIITSGLLQIRRTDLPYYLDLPRASGHCTAEYKYLHLCNRSNKVEKSVHPVTQKSVGWYKTCAHPHPQHTHTHISRETRVREGLCFSASFLDRVELARSRDYLRCAIQTTRVK
jgi:hypothetical protein